MYLREQTVYPNIAKAFRTQKDLGKLLHCSEKTVQRSMLGKRAFDEWELNRMEEYTGLSREHLLARRSSKC